MNRKLLCLTCALGLSSVVLAQACGSERGFGDAQGGNGAVAGKGGDSSAAGAGAQAGAMMTATAGTVGAGGTSGSTGGSGTAGAGAGIGGAGAGAGDAGAGAGGAASGAAGEGELTQAEICDQFCTDESVTCVGANEQYPDKSTCLTACSAFAPGGTMGDTLQCRVYHLNLAMTLPAVHCPHTAVHPPAVCVN